MATKRAELVHAPENPVRLTKAERAVVEEALRHAEDLRASVQVSVMSFGRWVLANVFREDPRSALSAKADNPAWRELLRLAGGPRLRISRKLLYSSVLVAAYDKRIGHGAWRDLDFGRKELLLPLRDDADLREAANHVEKFELTQRDTRAYVQAKLAGTRATGVRVRVTAPRIASKLKGLTAELARPAFLKRAAQLDLDDAARKNLLADIDALRSTLDQLGRAVRRR